MSVWGVAIPGLAMAAEELPSVPGLYRLENPEIGNGVKLSASYSLEDVAAIHLQTIKSLISQRSPLVVLGLSLGAMVASILASRFRSELPQQTTFRFLAPSLNGENTPAAPDALIEQWKKAQAAKPAVYRELLADFFSPSFKEQHRDEYEHYVEYRAFGRNNQSEKAFRRQTAALRNYRGFEHFSQLEPAECLFVRGAEDNVFGPEHMQEIIQLLPSARVHEIEGVGHMLNIEAPWVFSFEQFS